VPNSVTITIDPNGEPVCETRLVELDNADPVEIKLGNRVDECECLPLEACPTFTPCEQNPDNPFFGSWNGAATDQNPTWFHWTQAVPSVQLTPEQWGPLDPLITSNGPVVLREWNGSSFTFWQYDNPPSGPHFGVNVRSGLVTPNSETGVITASWTSQHFRGGFADSGSDSIDVCGIRGVGAVWSRKYIDQNRPPVFQLVFPSVDEPFRQFNYEQVYFHQLRFDQTTKEVVWRINGDTVYSSNNNFLESLRCDPTGMSFSPNANSSVAFPSPFRQKEVTFGNASITTT